MLNDGTIIADTEIGRDARVGGEADKGGNAMSVYCPTCHEYDSPVRHRCKPKFVVSIGGIGEEAEWERTVYARDAEEAAEVAAALYDSDGDYSIVSGCSAEFFVTDIHNVTKKFEVNGESLPEYRSTELIQELAKEE